MQIPESWRMSIIIPIFKKGEKTDVNNYRPISLTCTLCRVFERFIANHILNFLHEKNFFCSEQFGFLKTRSTTTLLITMLEEFYNSLDRNNKIDVIYLDFKKAFDMVPINILLNKVMNAGIGGKVLKFIQNFLKKRTYKVKIGNEFSSSFKTSSGVPQGSVLGPILFSIFINDLPLGLPNEISYKLYADDVKLYISHNNDAKREILEESLKLILDWTSKNGLELSINKCSVLHIGKHNNKKEYKLLDNILESYQNIRDLGIIIDKGLSFDDHINKIIRNAYFKIYQLLRILKTRDSDTLLRAYKAYIRPQLEYATEVWNPTKKGLINEIEKVQKHFTRRLFKL
uniref:Reverse transcriptase domain-containing protein n=1 Tax=Meloidogyne enterolobii TaxID=390850 RepID=A0A6V7XE90_MELEN|nr:unnamed protein product [Meloidogyne enterolobii]